MLVHRSLEGIQIRNAVVTTGSFDGVHVGHRVIINRLRTLAKATGGESVLITFYPHPRKVLYPDTQGSNLLMINTQREKIRLLEQAGLDHLVIIPFTLEFSKITSVDFIRHILVGKLKAKCVVVGFNHHFGHNREGDYEYLFELGKFYGFSVEEIPEQDIHNEFVSSTKIRKALTEGNIQRANAYLDHEFFILGQVKDASHLPINQTNWHEIIPEELEKQLPPPGIYAGSLIVVGERVKAPVMVLHAPQRNRVFFASEEKVTGEVALFFHKRMRLLGADEPPVADVLRQDLRMIDELIY